VGVEVEERMERTREYRKQATFTGKPIDILLFS
jgi:hypothetical protein